MIPLQMKSAIYARKAREKKRKRVVMLPSVGEPELQRVPPGVLPYTESESSVKTFPYGRPYELAEIK